MTSYVALLRGIAPLNPNMHNDKLRGVFESLGLANVRTLLSSGNVLFDSDSAASKLESQIEKAIIAQLGFTSTTIIRSRQELERLVALDPFKGADTDASFKQNITFLKHPAHTKLTFPHRPPGKEYELLSLHDRAVCSVIDITLSKTPDLMVWLEREFGKDITTRTYQTVQRIIKKF
jgi:uncharacterized protein (DUF1697 family)